MIIERRGVLVARWLILLLISGFILPYCFSDSPAPDSKSDAKKPYALLYGTVYDKNNRPVYGIKVKIRRITGKHASWELYSDHSGEFAQRVPPGAADYLVTADVKTPKGQPKPEVKVHVDNEERRDLSLHLN
ncbi:MAG TPA: carboxypeptidase-like regulatory domain-containing protein [Terriglobales bacterium]